MNSLPLAMVVLLPLVGGIAAWMLGRRGGVARWCAALALVLQLPALALARSGATAGQRWLASFSAPWIPRLGVRFELALDGLSLVMILLSCGLGLVAVLVSWRPDGERAGLFYLCLLWVLAGVCGVFLAMDLLLFCFFWELMLLPMALLIAIWGSERRVAAALKFLVFTHAGGLLLLLSVIGLAVVHSGATGTLSFDARELAGTSMTPGTAFWLFIGFMLGFAVKLPVVPLHSWLPEAHGEAPTAGSVVLAGLLLKTGAYGMLRFAVPLFPGPARQLAPLAMVLGALAVLYGAWLAFAQTDLKRLVAYTSVSHLGFVLLGIFACNRLALQGAVMQMICHGLSTGALFVVAGMLYERLHSRQLDRMGGLWAVTPRLGALSLVFALASLGLPGLGNFVAELLVLLGAFRVAPLTTALTACGLVLATVYALWLMQRVFFGPRSDDTAVADVAGRELLVLVMLAAVLLWLGLYPQPVLDLLAPALDAVVSASAGGGLL